MAAADFFRVTVRGRQTHGSTPWAGVDPVTAAAVRGDGAADGGEPADQPHRRPAVVTVGALNGGVRNNIIPDSAVMVGTIRTFDPEQRRQLHGAAAGARFDMAVQAQGATARSTSRR
jgi:amidohydrolase